MNMNNWAASREVHNAAHDHAHKEATKVANKLKKAIRRLYGFDNKVVVEAQYKSAYEQLYRDQLLLELVSLFRREITLEVKRLTRGHDEGLAPVAHLHQMFGLDPEALS